QRLGLVAYDLEYGAGRRTEESLGFGAFRRRAWSGIECCCEVTPPAAQAGRGERRCASSFGEHVIPIAVTVGPDPAVGPVDSVVHEEEQSFGGSGWTLEGRHFGDGGEPGVGGSHAFLAAFEATW